MVLARQMENNKHKRGFASMTPERRREVARAGGKAAHASGVAHKWTSETAKAAGKKGGTLISADRMHMASIGRAGARARAEKFQHEEE